MNTRTSPASTVRYPHTQATHNNYATWTSMRTAAKKKLKQCHEKENCWMERKIGNIVQRRGAQKIGIPKRLRKKIISNSSKNTINIWKHKILTRRCFVRELNLWATLLTKRNECTNKLSARAICQSAVPQRCASSKANVVQQSRTKPHRSSARECHCDKIFSLFRSRGLEWSESAIQAQCNNWFVLELVLKSDTSYGTRNAQHYSTPYCRRADKLLRTIPVHFHNWAFDDSWSFKC